jgi:hypothetical protein
MDERTKKIKDLYETTFKTMEEIAKECEVGFKVVFNFVKKTYTEEYRRIRKSECYRKSRMGELNPMFGKTGDAHHRFQGACLDGKGYVLILKPEWYTGRKGSKHVFLHSVIVCLKLGLTELPARFVVHHIDGDTLNNSIDNLALMTIEAHRRLHGFMGTRND